MKSPADSSLAHGRGGQRLGRSGRGRCRRPPSPSAPAGRRVPRRGRRRPPWWHRPAGRIRRRALERREQHGAVRRDQRSRRFPDRVVFRTERSRALEVARPRGDHRLSVQGDRQAGRARRRHERARSGGSSLRPSCRSPRRSPRPTRPEHPTGATAHSRPRRRGRHAPPGGAWAWLRRVLRRRAARGRPAAGRSAGARGPARAPLSPLGRPRARRRWPDGRRTAPRPTRRDRSRGQARGRGSRGGGPPSTAGPAPRSPRSMRKPPGRETGRHGHARARPRDAIPPRPAARGPRRTHRHGRCTARPPATAPRRRPGSAVRFADRSRNAAAAASPPRACARPAERSSAAATSSSGPEVAWARCHAQRSGSASGSVATASAPCAARRSDADADR